MSRPAERFQRHQHIPGWDQDRLTQADVIIVGVGALGNEVARLAALAGIGCLRLCDPDLIETSNLSRTSLFDAGQVGRNKAVAAGPALMRLAPDLVLDARPTDFVRAFGLAEIQDADLVFSCVDSRDARMALAGRCNMAGTPVIDGGTHPWGGEVRPFLQADGPCYGCTLSPEQRAEWDTPMRCGDGVPPRVEGACAPVAALTASWMVLMGLRWLMGQKTPDHHLVMNVIGATSHPITTKRDPRCPLHGTIQAITPVAVNHQATVGDLMAQLEPDAEPLLWFPTPLTEQTRANNAPLDPKKPIRPPTTMELCRLPLDQRLVDLGIPPREILPVRRPHGLEFIALAP